MKEQLDFSNYSCHLTRQAQWRHNSRKRALLGSIWFFSRYDAEVTSMCSHSGCSNLGANIQFPPTCIAVNNMSNWHCNIPCNWNRSNIRRHTTVRQATYHCLKYILENYAFGNYWPHHRTQKLQFDSGDKFECFKLLGKHLNYAASIIFWHWEHKDKAGHRQGCHHQRESGDFCTLGVFCWVPNMAGCSNVISFTFGTKAQTSISEICLTVKRFQTVSKEACFTWLSQEIDLFPLARHPTWNIL